MLLVMIGDITLHFCWLFLILGTYFQTHETPCTDSIASYDSSAQRSGREQTVRGRFQVPSNLFLRSESILEKPQCCSDCDSSHTVVNCRSNRRHSSAKGCSR